ncbi:MAG: OPT/YSL family transporter [Myxococcales bacterium]
MPPVTVRRSWLPRAGSPAYHALLVGVAVFILGPLGGITAAYMNFSLGFFVGGQVLAGILGSAVTYGYGVEGKHGANYMQTLAASVASLSGMCVLIQAMVWLGMPLPAPWKLMLFFFCVGMFGVGVGMLYTPLLVDRMRLEYPSGHAVANILRALTDPRLLRRSIGKLGGGTAGGAMVAALAERVRWIGATHISASNIGAGMVVGSRITVPATVYGAIGFALTPLLRAHGWLGPRDPFRKLGFLAALAMILGAALVDLSLVAVEAVRRMRGLRPGTAEPAPAVAADERDTRGHRLATPRLLIWCAGWAAALVAVAHFFFGQPVGWVLFAIALSVIFVYVNGVSCGITDSNPISSAFVVSVLLMSALGLKSPITALIASSVLLVSCSVGVDMQQDRSTGWRLGTNRLNQFRYQVLGVAMGAVMCVVLARLFMTAYPALTVDSYAHPEVDVGGWQSAMTFKFVGAIRDLGHLPAYKAVAIAIGLGLGFFTELARKLLGRSARYRAFRERDGRGRAAGWVMDAIVLPSPYASSFGGFVDLATVSWFGFGGALSSALGTASERRRRRTVVAPGEGGEVLPEDMSTTSLMGGGLIAGEALFALGLGLFGLLRLL